jgi:DNA (cytosine-5)-methyltransferase 1
VALDLECGDYTCAAVDLCAASVGAPHVRQRLFWVAHSKGYRRAGEPMQSDSTGSEEEKRDRSKAERCRGVGHANLQRREAIIGGGVSSSEIQFTSPWDRCHSVECHDGKSRPVKPDICPVAHGVPGRVGMLRGAGNAIVPQVAAEFIKAFLDLTD